MECWICIFNNWLFVTGCWIIGWERVGIQHVEEIKRIEFLWREERLSIWLGWGKMVGDDGYLINCAEFIFITLFDSIIVY